MNSIDLGRAFKAPFADKDWPMKTLLGFVWALLFFTLPAVYGAQLEYIRRVARGDERLPDWDDFGNKWVQGFLVLIAGFIYFLPVIVLFAILAVPALVAAASGGGEDMLAVLFGGGMCVFLLVATVYSIAVSIFFYAAQVHYAMSGSFGAFFDFGGIMAKVRGGTGYFMAWLYAFVVAFAISAAASFISSLTGGLGAILTPAVTYVTAMMVGHVLGQWAAFAYGVRAAGAPTPGPGAYSPPPPAPPAEYPAPPAPPAEPAPPADTPVPPAKPPAPPQA